jgi:hypothetical protein
VFTVRRLLALASVCALGVAVAACGNSGNGSATSTTSISGTSVPSNVPNQDAVRTDVTMSTCAPAHGGWSAGGTIKNTLGHDATYQITIFFTSAQASDLAYGQTSTAVKAKRSGPWTVTATFDAPSTVRCVLRGVAAS